MTETTQPDPPFSAWALLEMMGHRKEWGRVTEATLAGTPVLRVEVYREGDADPLKVMMIPPASLYALSEMPEDVCRRANGTVPSASDRLLPTPRTMGPEDDGHHAADLDW